MPFCGPSGPSNSNQVSDPILPGGIGTIYNLNETGIRSSSDQVNSLAPSEPTNSRREIGSANSLTVSPSASFSVARFASDCVSGLKSLGRALSNAPLPVKIGIYAGLSVVVASEIKAFTPNIAPSLSLLQLSVVCAAGTSVLARLINFIPINRLIENSKRALEVAVFRFNTKVELEKDLNKASGGERQTTASGETDSWNSLIYSTREGIVAPYRNLVSAGRDTLMHAAIRKWQLSMGSNDFNYTKELARVQKLPSSKFETLLLETLQGSRIASGSSSPSTDGFAASLLRAQERPAPEAFALLNRALRYLESRGDSRKQEVAEVFGRVCASSCERTLREAGLTDVKLSDGLRVVIDLKKEDPKNIPSSLSLAAAQDRWGRPLSTAIILDFSYESKEGGDELFGEIRLSLLKRLHSFAELPQEIEKYFEVSQNYSPGRVLGHELVHAFRSAAKVHGVGGWKTVRIGSGTPAIEENKIYHENFCWDEGAARLHDLKRCLIPLRKCAKELDKMIVGDVASSPTILNATLENLQFAVLDVLMLGDSKFQHRYLGYFDLTADQTLEAIEQSGAVARRVVENIPVVNQFSPLQIRLQTWIDGRPHNQSGGLVVNQPQPYVDYVRLYLESGREGETLEMRIAGQRTGLGLKEFSHSVPLVGYGDLASDFRKLVFGEDGLPPERAAEVIDAVLKIWEYSGRKYCLETIEAGERTAKALLPQVREVTEMANKLLERTMGLKDQLQKFPEDERKLALKQLLKDTADLSWALVELPSGRRLGLPPNLKSMAAAVQTPKSPAS